MISRILLIAIVLGSTAALLLPPAMAHLPSVTVQGSLNLANGSLLQLGSSAVTVGTNLTGKGLISLTQGSGSTKQVVNSYAPLAGFISGHTVVLIGLIAKSDNPSLVNAVVEITADASTGSVLLYFGSVVQNVQLQNTVVNIKSN